MTGLGFITGMKAEADLLSAALASSKTPHLIRTAGGNAVRAEDIGLEFAAAGAAGLVSFGIAGGLDPQLAPGDILVASAVILPDGEQVETDDAWRRALLQGTAAADSTVAGSDRMVGRIEDKGAMFAATGARAVDMESHGVARAARDSGLPIAVVRAIADPAGRAIPAAAQVGLDANGNAKPLSVMAQLMRTPSQIPAVMRVARDYRCAMRSLRAMAPVLMETLPR